MYKKLHVQSEIKSYNGKKVHITISIIPDFREAVIELTRFEEKSTILSDGKVTIKDELIVCEETDTKKNRRVVRVSKNAHWVLMATKYKEDYVIYEIYITERTKIIKTSLGNEVDEEFNRFIEECKRTYSERKKNEKRLYFYDAIKDKLLICYDEQRDFFKWDRYKYPLERHGYSKIDTRCKPEKSCFILGRIKKTNGLENSNQVDFIETINQIDFDLEAYQDKNEIQDLEKKVFQVLLISIAKTYHKSEVGRIRVYLQKNSTRLNYKEEFANNEDYVVSIFKNEIEKAFDTGNLQKILRLADAINEPQDCTNVNFKLMIDKDAIECGPNNQLCVYFENGESEYKLVSWIVANIKKCTNVKRYYLDENKNKYSFY